MDKSYLEKYKFISLPWMFLLDLSLKEKGTIVEKYSEHQLEQDLKNLIHHAVANVFINLEPSRVSWYCSLTGTNEFTGIIQDQNNWCICCDYGKVNKIKTWMIVLIL